MTTPSYTINTPFNNYFFYKNGPKQGTPLVGGTIDFFSAADHNQRLDTYSNIDDPDNPTVNPNPVVLGADGSTGNSTALSPVVYMQEEPYFIVVTSAEGDLQFTVNNYNGAILDPSVLLEVDPRNHIDDGQFNLGVPASNPVDGQLIDVAGWYFQRNNDTATDSVAFPPFALGETDVPQNPYAWLHYNCSVAGTGETTKQINFVFKNVRTFEGQICTLSLYAKSALTSTISIQAIQNFGTGGTPSANVSTPILSPSLTTGAAFYSATFTVPSCAGKTLGDNNDDTLLLSFNLPVNVTSDFYLTNVQWQLGNESTNYDYKTYEQVKSDAMSVILASETEDEDGASNVGYYDSSATPPAGTTVKAKLDSLSRLSNAQLVNSNFWVWTYGTTINCAQSSSEIFADRWSVTCGGAASGTAVVTQLPMIGTALQINANNFSNYYANIVHTTAGDNTTYCNTTNKIFGAASFNGKTVTISFGLGSTSAAAVIFTVQVVQDFGTGGSPSAAVVTTLGTFTIEPSEINTFSVTGAIPSVTGKTFGTNDDSNFQIVLSGPGGQNFTIQLTYLKVEIGSGATPYVGRGYTEELNACRAFRISTYPNGVEPGTDMSGGGTAPILNGLSPVYFQAESGPNIRTVVRTQIPFPVIMLKDPTVDIYAINGTINNLTLVNILNTSGSVVAVSNFAITATVTPPSSIGTGLYQIADVITSGSTRYPLGISIYYVADTNL